MGTYSSQLHPHVVIAVAKVDVGQAEPEYNMSTQKKPKLINYPADLRALVGTYGQQTNINISKNVAN
ncbi:hypothetical protein WAI453_011375 [Rhynchosporium graminicola]